MDIDLDMSVYCYVEIDLDMAVCCYVDIDLDVCILLCGYRP